MLIAIASLGVIALLALAISFVAFLVQTSRHRSSGKWAAAAGSLISMPSTCSCPTCGKKEGSPTSAVKMIFRYELRSRCIESPRKFPEPQAGSSLGHWRSPQQNGSEGR